MKQSFGFSLIEFILFLCICGLLIFLSIPFLRSFLLSDRPIPEQLKDVPSFSAAESNASIPVENIADSNLSADLPNL